MVTSRRVVSCFVMVLLAVAIAGAAQAQSSVLDRTRTTRGLIGDTSLTMAAQDAAERAGTGCDVRDAVLLDEDRITSSRHYEVSCRDGGGWIVVSSAAGDVAHDCLLVQAGAEAESRRGSRSGRPVACTLPANIDASRRYAAIAREAGVDCRVDGGTLVGRADGGALVFEIGCRGRAGAWVEQRPQGAVVTDCTEVLALGGRCELTSPEEAAAALSDWLPEATCRPVAARAMGRTAAGVGWYQLSCRGSAPVVVGREAGRTVEVLSCEDAAVRLEPCEGS
jgi:hypothetical protein